MKWEYKTEVRDYFELQEESDRLSYLNKEGSEGWELINMDIEDEVKITFWFKRMIDSRKDELLK